SRNVVTHEISDAIVGVEEVTFDLWAIDQIRQKGERNWMHAASLHGERPRRDLAVEVDALASEARRRPGFQAPPLEAERLQRMSEIARRRRSEERRVGKGGRSRWAA